MPRRLVPPLTLSWILLPLLFAATALAARRQRWAPSPFFGDGDVLAPRPSLRFDCATPSSPPLRPPFALDRWGPRWAAARDLCCVDGTANSKSTVVVAVISARNNFGRRMAIRRTWGATRFRNTRIVYVLGAPSSSSSSSATTSSSDDDDDDGRRVETELVEAESAVYGDVLEVPSTEGYGNVHTKVLHMMDWVAACHTSADPSAGLMHLVKGKVVLRPLSPYAHSATTLLRIRPLAPTVPSPALNHYPHNGTLHPQSHALHHTYMPDTQPPESDWPQTIRSHYGFAVPRRARVLLFTPYPCPPLLLHAHFLLGGF